MCPPFVHEIPACLSTEWFDECRAYIRTHGRGSYDAFDEAKTYNRITKGVESRPDTRKCRWQLYEEEGLFSLMERYVALLNEEIGAKSGIKVGCGCWNWCFARRTAAVVANDLQ